MSKPWVGQYQKGIREEIDPGVHKSIAHLLEETFHKYAQRTAFENMGTKMSYAQLQDRSLKFASFLQRDLGLKKGSRVALMMPNCLQYPVALFGALQAGMVAVNVNPLYTARELEHQLNDSGAEAIVIFANSAHILDKVIGKTSVKHVVVTEVGDLLDFPKSLLVNFVLKYVKKMVPAWSLPGSYTFKQVLAKGKKETFQRPEITLDDIAFLQYTGGTTGVAKGAILTHRNICANVEQAKEWIKFRIDSEGQEIIITPLPLYHIFSLTANCLIFSCVGAKNVLITNPRDIPAFIAEMKKHKFTAFTGVNTLFNALVNEESFKEIDFSHLKVALGGGMAVQRATAEKWKAITGQPLIEAYGLTETSPAACINPMDLAEYNGYIGLPLSSTEVVVKDDEGKDLPAGQEGEICIRGPQVMAGYWQRPEETAKVMTEDNYFRTGDIGLMTEQGFFKIVDRKKDMILVSGFNVYPNEIEDVVCQHQGVLECAAVGVPDEKSGEVVKVFVVKKDQGLSEGDLRKYCKENLTGYKVPKHYEFRQELPKSNVGKILRKELRPSV